MGQKLKMASSTKSAKIPNKKGGLTNEQIVQGFQDMRQQQRQFAGKISELEMEKKEYDLVLETLKEVEGSRKCFRLVGGVLVERTVAEVMPALEKNHENIGNVVKSLAGLLENKGKEINEYREKHNIRVRGEDENDKPKDKENKSAASTGVLVAKDSS